MSFCHCRVIYRVGLVTFTLCHFGAEMISGLRGSRHWIAAKWQLHLKASKAACCHSEKTDFFYYSNDKMFVVGWAVISLRMLKYRMWCIQKTIMDNLTFCPNSERGQCLTSRGQKAQNSRKISFWFSFFCFDLFFAGVLEVSVAYELAAAPSADDRTCLPFCTSCTHDWLFVSVSPCCVCVCMCVALAQNDSQVEQEKSPAAAHCSILGRPHASTCTSTCLTLSLDPPKDIMWFWTFKFKKNELTPS